MTHSARTSRFCATLASIAPLLLAAASAAGQSAEGWHQRVLQLPSTNQAPPVVTTVAIDAAGKLLASGGDDHVIRLWSLETNELLAELAGHEDWVRTLAFSPDGRVLASAGHDRHIRLWDPERHQPLRILARLPFGISSLVFSHDGTRLAVVGFSDRVTIFDTASGQQVLTLRGSCDDMRAVSFSPNDQQVAAGGRDGRVHVWSTADGNKLREMASHQRRVRALVFMADGRTIVSGGEDRYLRQWDWQQDRELNVLPQSSKVFGVAAYGPNQVAIAGTDNTVRLVDLATRENVAKLVGHSGSVSTVAARGQLIVSGSFDTTIRIWSREPNVAENRTRPPGSIHSASRIK